MAKAQPQVKVCACPCRRQFVTSHARRKYALGNVCAKRAYNAKVKAAAKRAGVQAHLSLAAVSAMERASDDARHPPARASARRKPRPVRVRPTLTPTEAKALVSRAPGPELDAATAKVAAGLARVNGTEDR